MKQGLRGFLVMLVWLASFGSGVATVAAQPVSQDLSAGPGAVGDNTYSGAIDSPTPYQRIGSPGSVLVAGWFVDRTAQGWAGLDDVEVFLGTMGNGGRLVAHAFFAQDRPDVGRALGNAYWSASGWSALVPTALLPPGTDTLSVYGHSPNRGWWYRQVSITVAQNATPLLAPAMVGFDISYPQCDGPDPAAPAFGVVGVNGGRAFTANPCAARQYTWALTAVSPTQPHVSFYMNTGNPGPDASPRWPAAGTALPRSCDGTWSQDCAYDYGWLAAQDAYARGRAIAGEGALLAPWWLDVEVANSWSSDQATNAADLQGAIGYLRSVNVGTIGIYALAGDWEEIVGAAVASAPQNAPFVGLPNWRPGAQSAVDARTWCARSVTSGRVLWVQYQSGSFDANLACP